MIGQPLQKINRLPNYNDYNKLVEILRPYQNLQIGNGLNGFISTSGISLSVSPTAQTNNFPFKVVYKSSTSLNVQFGRVFLGEAGTDMSELTCDDTFTEADGADIVAATVTTDALVIGVNKLTESETTYNRFTIGFAGVIDLDEYFIAQTLANVTQASAGVFLIEQVAGYDFVFSLGGGGGEGTPGVPERPNDDKEDKPYPFLTTINNTGDGIVTFCGRVYEFKAFADSYATDGSNNFMELAEINAKVFPDTIASALASSDYLSVVRAKEGETCNKWSLMYESAMDGSQYVVRRIARVYLEGEVYKVEQIHMGDVSWSEHTIAPFTVVRMGTSNVMYVPSDSIVINGVDYTSTAVASLTSSGLSNWYTIDGGGVTLWVTMKNVANQFGTVDTVEFNASSPTGDAIEIPIYLAEKKNVQIGAINREITRTDTGIAQTSGWYNSIEMSASDNFATGDRTLSLHGFVDNEGLDGSLTNTLDCISHSFGVREANSDTATVEMRWVSWNTLMCSIETQLTEDDWTPEGGGYNFETGLTEYFWYWYCSLEEPVFWEIGGSSTTNYGTSIGSDGTNTLITLAGTRPALNGEWDFGQLYGSSIDVTYAECDELQIINSKINGNTLEFCTTDGLVHFTPPTP